VKFLTRCRIAAASLALGANATLADPALVTTPFTPAYGDQVSVELLDMPWPVFLPALRYTKNGASITIDFEFTPDGFGPFPPSLGTPVVPLGELAPGTYWLHGRLIDLWAPQSPPKLIQTTITVAPPADPGVYPAPRAPLAFQPMHVVLRSAHAIDPASVRHSVSGNVIRIDYEHHASPSTGELPPGAAAFATLALAGLAPGTYQVEAWGKAKGSSAAPARHFTHAFAVAGEAEVVEFYSEALDHYFVSANPAEIAQLDSGAQPGWKRTGQSWRGWVRQGDAPANAKPVCRFYARGPNSHFYTADGGECDALKALEAKERSDASSARRTFTGWGYEGIALWALVPQDGACPSGTLPVYRSYNGRAAQNDSNHRLTPDLRMHRAMAGWLDEGVAFCSPR
jgi:hypothetical protein